MSKNKNQIMKNLFPLVIVSFLWNTAVAQQTCDCQKEFLFVKNYMETNYAGFSDKATTLNKKEYDIFTEKLLEQAKIAQSQKYCYYTIQSWLDYFNDGHTRLVKNPRKSSTDTIEKISLTPEIINELKNKPLDNIEGIYISQFKNYKIALIRNETNFRDYVGVIIDAKSKSWEAGQVKIELKHIVNDQYKCLYYLKDHQPSTIKYTIKDGKFNPKDFIKENAIENTNEVDPEPFSKLENKNVAVYYKDIDDSTAYLRIKSFDQHFAKKIAAEIKSNQDKLKSKPYLILDLRYNGGGSDFVYSPLLPFIYTNPIKTIGADVYSTPENIIAWQNVIDENPKLPEEVKKNLNDVISQMKANPNKLIPIVDDNIDTLTTFYTFPRKIAILIDEDCASSTEQFLLAAKQSKKVILMGRPTMGVLDYSNMRAVDLSCLPYTLGYSTSRSRRIPENAIDDSGIIPDVLIDFNKVWLKNVLESLKNTP